MSRKDFKYMNKKALNFIYSWEDKDRRSCWSGTPYGILSSLKKQYEVNDHDIGHKLNIYDKIFEGILYGYEFNIKATYDGIKKINALEIQKDTPCLVFLEYMSKRINDTYIYQDCSVDFLARLRQIDRKLVRFSPLPRLVNERGIHKRLDITKQFYNHCRGIFTMSKWLADDLIVNSHEKREKVHWVGGGCNIDVSKIDLSKKQGNRFLFVGKNWERKNGPLVVKAFKRLVKTYPDMELYIVGPAKIPEGIDDDRIKFVGRISYDTLIKYYNLCDFFVMPSQFEAYGIVFAEALIFGLPCIGKNCFAMPEFIEEGINGYLIERNSVEELVLKMKKILSNKCMAEFVKANSIIYQNMYSWDTVVRRMVKVFRDDGYDI